MNAVLILASLCVGQFLEGDSLAEAKSHWPADCPPRLAALKEKVRFYDARTMPQCFQSASDTGYALHSTGYNLAGTLDPFGQANVEFPWGAPAGLHQSPNFRAVRFCYFPAPALVWKQRLTIAAAPNQDVYDSYLWEFAKGTVFGEILLVKDKDGREHPFEIRLREKAAKDWKPEVYSPIRTVADLFAVAEPAGTRRVELRNNHVLKIVEYKSDLIELPALDARILRRLPFAKGAGLRMTTKEFSIVPKHYSGVPADCSSCHSTTLKHAWDYDMKRDWYGRVRGSDEIFTFHIFDPSSISYNGFPLPVRLRQSLFDLGIVRLWSSKTD